MGHDIPVYFMSLDPGKCTGWAIWHYGKLIACGARAKEEMFALAVVPDWHAVIEEPQAYVGRRSKGKPQDIVDLARYVGQLQAKFASSTLVKPAAWKGNLPKLVCKKRCKAELSLDELRRVNTENHNVWDAIGIGLWYLGRLKKGGKR